MYAGEPGAPWTGTAPGFAGPNAAAPAAVAGGATESVAAGSGPGSPAGGPGFCGSAAKNSLANLAMAATSSPASSAGKSAAPRLLVLMVVAHMHVFQHTECVVSEDRHRTVQRDQIGGDRLVVDPHETHRKAGRHFSHQPGLKEPDHALLLLTRAQQQDFGLVLLYRYLVAGNQRDSSPGQKRRTEQQRRGRRDAAVGALPAEGGDGSRVRQEEAGLLPNLRDDLVQIVGRGRARPGLYVHSGRRVVEQPVLFLVYELAPLAGPH